MKEYYKWKKLSAKADYHLKMIEIFISEIDNTSDPDARKKLMNLRSHHKRMARKYIAKSEICIQNAERE